MLIKCLDCSAMIDPSPTGRGPHRLRCDLHAAQRKKDLMRARTALIRAREWGVEAELVIAREVFERDDWICHLCGEPIPIRLRGARVPGSLHEPLGPVIDHVIPLSKRGPHTMVNCRAAHWTCNARKFVGASSGSDSAARTRGAKSVVAKNHAVLKNLLCELAGCTRQKTPSGLCGPHRRRSKLYGDPNKMRCACGCGKLVTVAADSQVNAVYISGHGLRGVPQSIEEKLRTGAKTQPVSDRGRLNHGLTDNCLVWTGSKNSKGYGRTYLRIPGQKRRGRVVLMHRLAYELVHGEGSADGLTIDHLCGVPLCCNPNHLEAVTLAVNLRRAADFIVACPRGHLYDEQNTDHSPIGHRRCRQCNTDRYHLKTLGHEFVHDPDSRSELRRRCLTCRQIEESTPQFCPYGHEYTPMNKRIGSDGKRYCQQCIWDRTHVPRFGHAFVPDPDGPVAKRRCLTCRELNPTATHCVNGHEFSDQSIEYTAKGRRNCVICRLNARHMPQHGHEYVIDPDNPTTKRRCLVCLKAKQAVPQYCPAGHEFTPENTILKSGWRNCRACGRNREHRKLFDHNFVADPQSGKRVSCLTCSRARKTFNQ